MSFFLTAKDVLKKSPPTYSVLRRGYHLVRKHADIPHHQIAKAKAFASFCRVNPLLIDRERRYFLERQDDYRFSQYWVNTFCVKEGCFNITPSYEKVLTTGFSAIEQDVRVHLKTDAKSQFHMACSIECEAIRGLIERWAAKLSQLAEQETDPVYAQRFREAADIRRRVPLAPARSFREALESLYFTQVLVWMEGNRYIGLGRIDQYLYPYFRLDLDAGRIARQEAFDLLVAFFDRLNDSIDYRSNHLLGDSGQTIMLGGVDPWTGRDATNDLSSLCLEAAKMLKKTAPNVKVRLHSGTPGDFIANACELGIEGPVTPTFCNDEVILPALRAVGYADSDAGDYTVGGCWEPIIPGRSFDRPNVSLGQPKGKIVFLRCLEAALNHGKSFVNGEEIGPDLGGLSDYSSFAELMSRFKEQIRLEIDDITKRTSKARFLPAPLLSLLMNDCLGRAKDISEGGARYNNCGILGGSLADAVDSLMVLKRFVFDEQSISKADMIAMLSADFNGYETQRRTFIRDGVKFGNDDDRADMLAKEVAEFYCREVSRHRNHLGGVFKPSLASENGYVEAAKLLGASPNGRRAGTPFGSNFSAALGTDHAGPTALMRSCCKIDLRLAPNGAVTDVMLDSAAVKGPNGIPCLVNLLKGFVAIGGSEVQFNITDKNLLKDAQAHPERYPNLIVRVWGFSARYVTLPREYQDQIIARTAYRART